MSDNYIKQSEVETTNELLRGNVTGRSEVVTEKLVRAMCQGDEDAFRTVYYRYRESLLGFLVRLTGSQADSEDIVQSVYVYLWENRSKIDPAKNIKSYIYTISKNLALRLLKSSKSHDILPDALDIEAEGYAATDEDIITRETSLLVDIAVSNMPRKRKEVFELYRQGLSYEEIAARTDITTANVRKYIMRARNDIREMLMFAISLLLP